jgi:2',3'-cyclic-nucleotide 2'-phosphodiesterase (5'-nucleotidase family)
VGGGILGDKTQGEAIVAGMNLMAYDAMALGPKELELGTEILAKRAEEAQFPMLSANAIDSATGELFAKPFVVVEIGEHRVGIIGLTRSPEAPLPGFEVLDPEQVLSEVVSEVQQQAETVVVLTNMPYEEALALGADVPGIDLMVAALPTYIPPQVVFAPGTATMVVSAEMPTPKHTGRRVGRLQVTLNGDGSLGDPNWLNEAMGPGILDDAEMAELLDSYGP